MANRTIKVNTPSVATGDTLVSYNVYSDKPSAKTLIGSMTSSEGNGPGKTFNIPDGLNHNVTVYPVGGSGEFNAPSNVLNFNLTVSQGIIPGSSGNAWLTPLTALTTGAGFVQSPQPEVGNGLDYVARFPITPTANVDFEVFADIWTEDGTGAGNVGIFGLIDPSQASQASQTIIDNMFYTYDDNRLFLYTDGLVESSPQLSNYSTSSSSKTRIGLRRNGATITASVNGVAVSNTLQNMPAGADLYVVPRNNSRFENIVINIL